MCFDEHIVSRFVVLAITFIDKERRLGDIELPFLSLISEVTPESVI